MFFNAYKAMSSNSHYSISIILSIHNFYFHSVIDLWLYTWFGVVWITLCVIDVGEFLVASHELLSAALSGQVTFFKHLLELWNSNQCVQELRHRLSPSTTEIQTHTQVPRSFIKIKVQYKCNYTEIYKTLRILKCTLFAHTTFTNSCKQSLMHNVLLQDTFGF